MANPTTNYGFVLPTATDLVTDLPADFDVALQGVDTRLKALQPGTTLGDLAYSSATANTNTRLGIGSTGNVLTVSGGVPVWAAPAGGAADYTLINAGGTALTGATSITVSGISGKNSLIVIIQGASSVNTAGFEMRLNSDSALNYDYIQWELTTGGTSATAGFAGNNSMDLFTTSAAGGDGSMIMFLDGCNSTGLKRANFVGRPSGLGKARIGNYVYRGTSAISSVTAISSSGNFDAGTIYVYGA